ncbi:hypothetical protein [Staphylococcus xylosus]
MIGHILIFIENTYSHESVQGVLYKIRMAYDIEYKREQKYWSKNEI